MQDCSSNEDRLEFLFLNLVGTTVKVHLVDGSVLEGVFATRADHEEGESDDGGIYLSCSHYTLSTLHSAVDPAHINQKGIYIRYKDIIFVEANQVRIRHETPGAQTSAYRGNHDLKTMDWATEGTEELLEDSKGGKKTEWNQFDANEKMFGCKSTYNEELYTTKLDHSKISEEQLAYANQKAKEIEGSAIRGVQHALERGIMMDDKEEGELYSDVVRPEGKKQPPPRGNTGKTNPNSTNNNNNNNNTNNNKRRGQEEVGDSNLNPASTPFLSESPIENYLTVIARAIEKTPECYASAPDWPGDSENTLLTPPPKPPVHPQRPPPAGPPHHQHHQHQHHHHQHQHQHQHQHHNMNSYNPAAPTYNPNPMPGPGYSGPMGGYDNMQGNYAMPPPPQTHNPNRPPASRGPKYPPPPQPQQPLHTQVPVPPVDSADKHVPVTQKKMKRGIGKDDSSKKGPQK